MLLAASTLFKRNRNLLRGAFIPVLFFTAVQSVNAQGNSPYSRYGLGDMFPGGNVVSRSMGGVSAADANMTDTAYLLKGFNYVIIQPHINFNNPASFSSFYVAKDPRSNKIAFGRVLLDAGVNIEDRTISEPNNINKFTSSDLYFSYLQFGIPLKKGWGLSFGLRPVTRIYYKLNVTNRIPNIDSASTDYNGNGGSYLPNIGTGIAIGNLSLGGSLGYLFGNRQSSSDVYLENDSIQYYRSTYKTATSFGNIFTSFGAQYLIKLNPQKGQFLRLGAYGNFRQKLKASQDRTIGTFTLDPNATLTDTVYKSSNVKGEIIYPSSYTFGFALGGLVGKTGSWLAGADLAQTQWSKFRVYDSTDAVGDNWQLRIGGQLIPELGKGYFSRVTYRTGFFVGRDYITASGKLPVWGASLGLGLPVGNYNRLAQGQLTTINLGFEYNSRGNNTNLLKEDTYRLSVGLNFGDIWFNKRKYD